MIVVASRTLATPCQKSVARQLSVKPLHQRCGIGSILHFCSLGFGIAAKVEIMLWVNFQVRSIFLAVAATTLAVFTAHVVATVFAST